MSMDINERMAILTLIHEAENMLDLLRHLYGEDHLPYCEGRLTLEWDAIQNARRVLGVRVQND